VIHPAPSTFPLSTVDLRDVEETEREERALRLATEDIRRPFDLQQGPLLRMTLIKMSETDYRLRVVAHLSIVDGVSVYQVFPSELATLYSAFSAGKSSPLPELAVQYGDYAYWQQQSFKEADHGPTINYWRMQLAGEPPLLQWPIERPRRPNQSCRGAIRSFAIDSSAASALKQFVRLQGVTLFTTFVAAFGTLLHYYTQQVDLIIGTPSPAGRKLSEVQQLLGYFLNPVALRLDMKGDPTFVELLARVQKTVAGAIGNDDLPLEVLAKEMKLRPGPSHNPFFTVALSVQPETPDTAAAWQVTSMDADSGAAVWDVYIAFIHTATELVGRVQYNPDRFDESVITDMIFHLKLLVTSITTLPGQKISHLRPSMARPHGLTDRTTSLADVS
jgi:surfactin family lipopeptide synthetase A